ncbi:MAG TPA: hypothetical protein VF691_03540 [Cytophagaceae bacterium]
MMIYKILCSIIICFVLTTANAQSSKSKRVLIYTCDKSNVKQDSCYLKTQQAYGFVTRDLGCIKSKKIEKRFNKNNKKAERELEQIHGEEWKKKFNEEVKACRKE